MTLINEHGKRVKVELLEYVQVGLQRCVWVQVDNGPKVLCLESQLGDDGLIYGG